MQQTSIEHQAANVLSHQFTTRTDESPLEEVVTVLKITEAQPEGDNTKIEANNGHSLPDTEGKCALMTAFPEVSQVSD